MTKSPLTTLPPASSSSPTSSPLLLSQLSEFFPTNTPDPTGGGGTGSDDDDNVDDDDPAVVDGGNDYDEHDHRQEKLQQHQIQQTRRSVASSRNSSIDLHSSIVSEITMEDDSSSLSLSFAGVDNLSFGGTSTASLLTSNSARFAPSLPLPPVPTGTTSSNSRRRYSKTKTTKPPHSQKQQQQHRRQNHQDHRLVPPVRHESMCEGTDAKAAAVIAAAAAAAAAAGSTDDDDSDDIYKDINHCSGGGPTPKRESICISSFLPNAAVLEESADAAVGEDDAHDESFHVLQLHHKAKGTTAAATTPTGRNTSRKPSPASSFDDSLDPLMAAMQISSSRRNSNFGLVPLPPSVAAAATASASEAPPVQPRRLSSINGDFDRSQFAPTLPSFSETPNGHSSSSSSSSSSSTSSTKDKNEEETSNITGTNSNINSTDTIVGDDDWAGKAAIQKTPPVHHHQKSSSTKQGKMMKGRRHGTAGTTTGTIPTTTLSNQQQRRPSHDDSMVMSNIQKRLVMSSITMDSALMIYDDSGHSQTNSTNWSNSTTSAAPAAKEEEEVARPSKHDIYDEGDHDGEDDGGNDIWEEDMTDSGIRNEQTTTSPSSRASRSTRSSSIVVPPVHSESRFVSSPIPTNHHGSSSLQVPKRRESSLDNYAIVLEAAAATTAFRSTSAVREVAEDDSLTNRTSDDLHSNTKRMIREAPPALPERQLSIDDLNSFDPYVPDVIPELGSDHPDDDHHPIIDFSSPRNNMNNTKRQSSSRFPPTKIPSPSRPGMAGKDLSSSTLPTQAMTATSSHTFATTTHQYFNGTDSSRCMYDDSFSRDM